MNGKDAKVRAHRVQWCEFVNSTQNPRELADSQSGLFCPFTDAVSTSEVFVWYRPVRTAHESQEELSRDI